MKGKNILSLVLCCLLFALLHGTCGAAEISDQDLLRLENNLAQLQINLQEREKRYQKVSDLLVKSDKQIMILESQLTRAELLIDQTQNSLQNANKSLEKLEKETKAKIRKVTLQRDLTILGAVAMAVMRK